MHGREQKKFPIDAWGNEFDVDLPKLKAKVGALEVKIDLILKCLEGWDGTGFTARVELEKVVKELKEELPKLLVNGDGRRIELEDAEQG